MPERTQTEKPMAAIIVNGTAYDLTPHAKDEIMGILKPFSGTARPASAPAPDLKAKYMKRSEEVNVLGKEKAELMDKVKSLEAELAKLQPKKKPKKKPKKDGKKD